MFTKIYYSSFKESVFQGGRKGVEMSLITVKDNVFHLRNNYISYIFMVEEKNYLSHIYYGEAIAEYSNFRTYPRIDRSFSPNPPGSEDRLFSIDTLLMEYPGGGLGDFRSPAHIIQQADGSSVTDFRYEDYKIFPGKQKLEGLPATYVEEDSEAETLIVRLVDRVTLTEAELSYTIYKERPVLTRSVRIKNRSSSTIRVKKAGSLNIDFPKVDLDLIHFNGSWARERQMTRESIETGIKILDSKRGSSSHHQNPFVILAEKDANEFSGDVFGFCLVYSGNHETLIEKDPYDQVRFSMGINAFDFDWKLDPSESFQTPEVVMVFSKNGFNEMSQSYHKLFNERLARGKYKMKERPILINNWEATYFDFNEEKITNIVHEASDLGIELFVLDDGWFGHRNDDFTSLGDWYEQPGKLRSGLIGLSKMIHEKGMDFGLWFEPEMISENSDLFREHPDWALQIPKRGITLGRDQYVLDFSREDVRENIFSQMTEILDSIPIEYVKWDMNRNMSEVYSLAISNEDQGSVAHRYILGLYDFMEKLIKKYPNILFESCSGGGGRFDAGLLYYMPQAWTSDNTDAIERLKIQYGTSFAYPVSSMGAHVSAIPNHQTGRDTSFETRGNVAMSGVLGYELDLTLLTKEEKNLLSNQVDFYKKHRNLLQYGTFTRLKNPFNENSSGWMFVSDDKKEALVFYFKVLSQASPPIETLKLKGLSTGYRYTVNDCESIYGDELMKIGLYVDVNLFGDYVSKIYYLKAE